MFLDLHEIIIHSMVFLGCWKHFYLIFMVCWFQIIERIVDFSRHQIMECMLACDPSYRALHRPRENGVLDGKIHFFL